MTRVWRADKPGWHSRGAEALHSGALRWIEIPRDDAAFFAFLKKVVALLEEPEPPASAPECSASAYRQMARKTGW